MGDLAKVEEILQVDVLKKMTRVELFSFYGQVIFLLVFSVFPILSYIRISILAELPTST